MKVKKRDSTDATQPEAKRMKFTESDKEKLEDQLAELRQENDEIRAAADRNAVKFCKVARLNREYLEENNLLRQQLENQKKDAEIAAKVKTKLTKVEAQLEASRKNDITMHEGIKLRTEARSELRKVKQLEKKVQLLERDLEVSEQKSTRLQKKLRSQKSAPAKQERTSEQTGKATSRMNAFLEEGTRNLRLKNKNLETMVKHLQNLLRKQK